MLHIFMTYLFSLMARSQHFYFLVNTTAYYWLLNHPFLIESLIL